MNKIECNHKCNCECRKEFWSWLGTRLGAGMKYAGYALGLYLVGLYFFLVLGSMACCGEIAESTAWILVALTIIIPLLYIYSPNRISLKGGK